MKILRAKHMGFCFGVKRAVDIILEQKEKTSLYGDLIHNQDFLNYLKERGIVKGREGTIAIRAHGITKQEYEDLKDYPLLDLTCPFVQKAQDIVKENNRKQIIILGDKDHPEVKSIASFGEDALIVKNIEEIPEINKPIVLLTQTTQKVEDLDLVREFLESKYNEVETYNTICNATRERQESAKELARQVDLMIVIGGEKSANTKKLKEVCERYCKTIMIQNEKDITDLKNVETIGVTAGASTPEFVINNVIKKLEQL